MGRAERLLRRRGVSRVILPRDFPGRAGLRLLRPVEILPLYRAHADVLALQMLQAMGREEGQAVVALWGSRMSPELYQTACRLCPRVRGLSICIPGEGDHWARRLLAQYGIPALPAETACLTVAFSPGEREAGRVLRLYGAGPVGLRLRVEGWTMPMDWEDGLLAALWERGCLDRRRLRADLTLPLDKWGESTYNPIE